MALGARSFAGRGARAGRGSGRPRALL